MKKIICILIGHQYVRTMGTSVFECKRCGKGHLQMIMNLSDHDYESIEKIRKLISLDKEIDNTKQDAIRYAIDLTIAYLTHYKCYGQPSWGKKE